MKCIAAQSGKVVSTVSNCRCYSSSMLCHAAAVARSVWWREFCWLHALVDLPLVFASVKAAEPCTHQRHGLRSIIHRHGTPMRSCRCSKSHQKAIQKHGLQTGTATVAQLCYRGFWYHDRVSEFRLASCCDTCIPACALTQSTRWNERSIWGCAADPNR